MTIEPKFGHEPDGILFDAEGNVVFDRYAEATGTPPFRTRAEVDAAGERLQLLLAERRRERLTEEPGDAV